MIGAARSRPGSAPWPRLPRRTARLRLTVLYGAVFFVCAMSLLAITYLLVASNAPHTPDPLSRGAGDRGSLLPAAAIKQATTRQADDDLKQLQVESGIALGIATVVAVGLGWLAAGRILRPLATITATARRISATSLDERLNMPGPDDELKELGDTLDGLFARLDAAFEAQRHFIANASHELRTPLTADRALLQVALDSPAATADVWRTTGKELLASNTEQERLIEALLTLATSEAGLQHRERVDLSCVVAAVLLNPRTEAARLDLRFEVAAKPAVLHGDPVLAQRLVANLVDNAVSHNVHGGLVQIATSTAGGRAVLSVASTGPAIPPGKVSQLFQPFQRLQPRGAGHGHGIGLSIVRAIATAHDAAITAQALPGGGLGIDVTFPPADPSAG